MALGRLALPSPRWPWWCAVLTAAVATSLPPAANAAALDLGFGFSLAPALPGGGLLRSLQTSVADTVVGTAGTLAGVVAGTVGDVADAVDKVANGAIPALPPLPLPQSDVEWRYHLERLVRELDDNAAAGGALDANLLGEGPDKKKHLIGTRALVEANGYPVEEHEVRSADGYLLTGFRVPRPGRPVVFLMHGLLSSSADYVFLGKGRALAMVLYDAGFDVWMGNARGNTASRRHERLKPSQAKFWDFSWHQIGVYDLPAFIDHVLAATNQTALHYVGHSQGTTSFFVLASERPEYMDKIKTFTGLAPVAFVRDVRSIPIRIMSLAPNTLAFLFRLVGVNEFLPSTGFLSWLGDTFCADTDITQPLCYNILFLVGGADSKQLNKTALPDIMANTPAGASVLQLLHYGQLVDQPDLVFRQFDHGWMGNMAHYRSLHPPEYDLSRVTARTYLVHADNDLLSVQSNVEELTRRLPNIAPDGLRRVPFAEFNHLDYVMAVNAKELVYDDIVATVREYEAAASEAAATGGR